MSGKLRVEVLKGERATVYFLGCFGATRIEVSEFTVSETGSALEVRYRLPRARSWKGHAEKRSRASIVVLDGWGHPDHPTHDPSPDGRGSITRYASFAEEWGPDFDRFLLEYVGKTAGVRVLCNYRQQDPGPTLQAAG